MSLALRSSKLSRSHPKLNCRRVLASSCRTLTVTQSGAETKLYHHTGGKPGLRVRPLGAPGNPRGAGAVRRVVFGGRQGPARAVLAGSGYWSQESAVQVLARPEAATQLWVRWPG